MTRKRRKANKAVQTEGKKVGVAGDDKQLRSMVSFGLFPLAYAIGFIPEMAYMKQMILFAVSLVAGNIALMRLVKGKQLIYVSAVLFILGSVLNIVFLGTSQSIVLVVLGVVFAMKMKGMLESYR